MKWFNKMVELVQSRKFYGMVGSVWASYEIWQSIDKTPMTTAVFMAAVVGAISVWVSAQGRVDAAGKFDRGPSTSAPVMPGDK